MKSGLGIAVLLIVIACIAYFFLVIPSWNKVSAVNEELAHLQDLFDRSQELRAQRDSLIAEYNSLGQEVRERVDKMIPQQTSDALFAYILELQNIAREANVIIENPSFSEQPSFEGEYDTISFTFNVETSYYNMKRFLGIIEKSLRIIHIERLSIVVPEDGVARQDGYLFRVTLNTFLK